MQRGNFATKICEIVTKFLYLITKCEWIFSLISSPEHLALNNISSEWVEKKNMKNLCLQRNIVGFSN